MKIQRYGIKRIKRGKNTVFIPKIVPDGYGDKFIREDDILPLLNPWKDAEKEKPEEKTEVLVKLSSADGFFHSVGIYRSEFKDWFFYDPELINAVKSSIVYILSWMHIPKNEGEEL